MGPLVHRAFCKAYIRFPFTEYFLHLGLWVLGVRALQTIANGVMFAVFAQGYARESSLFRRGACS